MTEGLNTPLEFHPNLDEKLDQLVDNILNRLRIEPSDADALIRDSLSLAKLRVKRTGSYDVNAYSTLGNDGKPLVIFGQGLYSFIQHYASCAAAYFIPSIPNGPRPSQNWPAARDSLAVSLNMLAIPGIDPPPYAFPLTKHQAERALIFGNYAFRFVICHEMAHVALGHINPQFLENRVIDEDLHATLLANHDMEFAADRLGFSLHTKSLESPLLTETAIATAVYFLHATHLIRLRLMLLARLVDVKEWKIEFKHPPVLARFGHLLGKAVSDYGDDEIKGLPQLDGDLDLLDGEIRVASNLCRERVANDGREVISAAISRILHEGVERAVPKSIVQEISQLYERSPVGIAEAFDENVQIAKKTGNLSAHLVAIEKLIGTIPNKLQRFWRLSRRNRTRRVLLKPLLAHEQFNKTPYQRLKKIDELD